MPTLFTWDYEETPATAGRGGEQRCEAGGKVVVSELGDCTLRRVDGEGDGRIVRAQHKVGETVTSPVPALGAEAALAADQWPRGHRLEATT